MKTKFIKSKNNKKRKTRNTSEKLIIFDFDGVLRSVSMEGIFRGYIALLRYAGKNQKDFFNNMEEFQKWFSSDLNKNIERIGIKKEDLESSKIFHSHYDAHVCIFPWVEKLLTDIYLRHTLVLFTSSSEKSVCESLGKLNKFFSLVVCNDHIQKLKPDPEGIYFILEKLQRKSDDALIIGDTTADILAGKAAGIKTGVVGWGEIDKLEDLLKLNPDFVFHKPEDLFLLCQ